MSYNSASFDTAILNPAGHDVPPVGFRFRPTDQQIITIFLGLKNQGHDDHDHVIATEEVFKIDPWDLPARSMIKSKDQVWYFYTRRERKFKKGNQYNRTTKEGYWKPQGNPRPIKDKRTKEVTGWKRTLVFHHGRPKGRRTQWVMHEYECSPNSGSSNQGDFVLCKLKNKSDEKYPKYDTDYLQTSSQNLSQPPNSTIPNSHTQNFPSLLASNYSLVHNQNNGIGDAFVSQIPSQIPKLPASNYSLFHNQNNGIGDAFVSQIPSQIPTLLASSYSLFHNQNNGIGDAFVSQIPSQIPTLLASSYSLFHNQNNGIGDAFVSQIPSQIPKITLQTSNIQNSDSVGAITTSLCCYQNNDITEVALSLQAPQIPKTTFQTSDIQTFDSPPAINSSLCHYQNNGISEFTSLDREEQANANYSKVFEDSFHWDASDGYPISPSQSAIFGGAVVDSTPDVADSLMVSDFENQNLDNQDGIPSASVEFAWSPSMATSYTDYGTQNQYENFDILDYHDGQFASDLESKYEEPEQENSELSSELRALLESMHSEFPTLDP